MDQLIQICIILVLAPLFGSVIAGLFRHQIGRTGAHLVTIGLVGVSFILSLYVAKMMFIDHLPILNENLYNWASGGDLFPYQFNIGFLIDPLTSLMMVVVTFVSLLVHIYSIGYMADDDGYQRFFSYISLFTFAMLTLVTANNFLQLFFGWEGVGLVSYLLIGFWYDRESANQGSFKAFMVNRVGDFGFILGIGAVLTFCGSLDYAEVFSKAASIAQGTTLMLGYSVSNITLVCLLLFVGAMGKSAQVPLHVWLPESMEGPTPISALIHAATMVTAGVFMVARMSPLFELSETALSFILIIGATGALFTGLLAIVMNDIKRVVAYSTLSQLGYMMVAMGASAYSAGIFHLATHACFKAVLFLGAGSVIIAMHHEQDMTKMGGLAKRMPITYLTFLLAALALTAVPPFAGFFSKDSIIEAAELSTIPGASYAYFCVAAGAFVTALYTFRQLFMTFHGTPRMSQETYDHVHESPWVVWLPLVILAIPSVLLGYFLIQPMLFAANPILGKSVFVLPAHNVLATMEKEFHGPLAMIMHSVYSLTFWLTLAGIATAWICYSLVPSIPTIIMQRFNWLYRVFVNKYGFDQFNDWFFIRGGRALGQFLFGFGDQRVIDGMVVNGSSRLVRWVATLSRGTQTGYLYHYATVMVLGLISLLVWVLF